MVKESGSGTTECPLYAPAACAFTVQPVGGWYLSGRAVAEFVAALIMLAFGAPLILLAAVLVRLTSRGPAFFRQVRVGQGGRPYVILKIRSMYDESEENSVRRRRGVTPVGRLLRRTHVDELPQLWHVLSGEMSLIGPRPEQPEFVRNYTDIIPRYAQRLCVRPGLTGLAQVQAPPDMDSAGIRNLTLTRRKLAYDLYYVQSIGPWLDLRILLCTALKVFGMPFPALRRACALPSLEAVETVYEPARTAAPVFSSSAATPTVELQRA
jgi:lipopolysaccharide/colanic/teichoic acid biosynthesis glycosyltransferase